MTAGTGDNPACFALTRNGKEVARVPLAKEAASGTTVPTPVSELQLIGFSLAHRASDVEYAVTIGDVTLAPGRAFGPNIYWEDGLYFESTRGSVRVHLRTRATGSMGDWQVRAHIDVSIVPTKLGERRYDSLVDDIRHTAAGLVFDIVSKMFRGVRHARGGLARVASQANHLELASLHHLWRELSGPLAAIVDNPYLRAGRLVQLRSYNGTGILNATTASRLATRGFDPRRRGGARSVTILGEALTPTKDTVEHRVIVWFLRLLAQRVRRCIESAQEQIALIEADRELRDTRLDDGPTLYEEVDLPKIERLRACISQGRELGTQIRRAERSPLFRDVGPQEGATDTPVFQHVEPYYRFGLLMRRYVAESLVILEAGEGERLKATSRLYEHWVFLRLAEAFRSCGLRGGDMQGIVRRLARHRFVLDLDDDVVLTFHADHSRVVRLRYEPWILPVGTARSRGEALCRGMEGSAPAWRPDVLVEFIDGSEVMYAVVVDSKYSSRIRDHHWSRVEKYSEIRTVAGLRQVVRQVWLAYPGEGAGIRCRDTAVTWTPCGPDRPRDEIIMGELRLRPAIDGTDGTEGEGPAGVARDFVGGLMGYVGFSVA